MQSYAQSVFAKKPIYIKFTFTHTFEKKPKNKTDFVRKTKSVYSLKYTIWFLLYCHCNFRQFKKAQRVFSYSFISSKKGLSFM